MCDRIRMKNKSECIQRNTCTFYSNVSQLGGHRLNRTNGQNYKDPPLPRTRYGLKHCSARAILRVHDIGVIYYHIIIKYYFIIF